MLDPVVHIQKQSLGIADGDMYPRQYLLHVLLVRNHRLVFLYMFSELMVGGGIISGQFDGRFKVFLRNIGDCLCLQVWNDLHLQMSYHFGRLSFPGMSLRKGTFHHDHHFGLLLTATSPF